MVEPKIPAVAFAFGCACLAAAGLKVFGYHIPFIALTSLGVVSLAVAKFRQSPAVVENGAGGFPAIPESLSEPLNRYLPTIMELVRAADGALSDHERFEAAVGGGDGNAYRLWALSALRTAAYWTPVSLLAMLAGAALVSPFKLVSGGLGLAGTVEGNWLLRQYWPRLVAQIAAMSVLQQAYFMGAFSGIEALLKRWGFETNEAAACSAAALGVGFLTYLHLQGNDWMKVAPLLGIELALIYSYARTRTILVPAAANVALGLMSLYSARMIVLLTANLGSIEDSPGIPGLAGVLAVLGVSLGLFAAMAARNNWTRDRWGFLKAEALAQWERARSLGAWWSRTSEVPKSPLELVPAGLLWGIGIYLASYLSYYAVQCLAPAGETVPAALKQVLLMPFDVLLYVFLIGAALEELIFRFGLFNALAKSLGADDYGQRFWTAAVVSAAIFSAFHFVDLTVFVRFLGVHVSKLVQSLMVVYGFSWPGFAGRVAAGIVLAALYRRSGVLLIPIIAHFTSNLLEAVGLRWGLPWFLAAVAGIFALHFFARMPPEVDVGGARRLEPVHNKQPL